MTPQTHQDNTPERTTGVHSGNDTQDLTEPVWVFGDGVKVVHTPSQWKSPEGSTRFQYETNTDNGTLMIQMEVLATVPLMMVCKDGHGLMSMHALVDVVSKTITHTELTPELKTEIRKNALGLSHMGVLLAKALKHVKHHESGGEPVPPILAQAINNLEVAVARIFDRLRQSINNKILWSGLMMELTRNLETKTVWEN